MPNWTDVYEWLNTHPAFGRETLQTRQQIQVAVYFRQFSSTNGQHSADILRVSRERVRQLLARASELYESPQVNINWTVYHWLLENYPTETSIGQRCRALESLQLKVDGLSYKEISKQLSGKEDNWLMHSTRCAWARKTHRRSMAFFVELMDRVTPVIEQE